MSSKISECASTGSKASMEPRRWNLQSGEDGVYLCSLSKCRMFANLFSIPHHSSEGSKRRVPTLRVLDFFKCSGFFVSLFGLSQA